MYYSVKQLAGTNDELIGKWVKVTQDEETAIRDSIVGENYARGAVGKPSLRLYFQEGYAVLCTQSILADAHPTAAPPKVPTAPIEEKIFVATKI